MFIFSDYLFKMGDLLIFVQKITQFKHKFLFLLLSKCYASLHTINAFHQ